MRQLEIVNKLLVDLKNNIPTEIQIGNRIE